jgi:hypothetical protein
MATTTKTERGKTQVEVSTETRRKLRLLAALTETGMAEAADDAISRRLTEIQDEEKGPVSRGGYPVGP